MQELDQRLKDIEERQAIYSLAQLQELDLSIKAINKRLMDIEKKLAVESEEKIMPAANQREER